MKECKILLFQDRTSNWETWRLVTHYGSKQTSATGYEMALRDNPAFEESINSYLEQGWIISGFTSGNPGALMIMLTR